MIDENSPVTCDWYCDRDHWGDLPTCKKQCAVCAERNTEPAKPPQKSNMNVRELRIGSILQGKNWYRTVKELHKDHFVDEEGLSTLYRDAKPVILSEDVLNKFGIGSEWHSKFGIGRIVNSTNVDEEDSFKFLYYIVIATQRKIKHLHHLQNIIFDLSGKELPIKK